MDLYLLQHEIKGRCVYAKRDFEVGELLEICPVIVIPHRELVYLDKTVLYDYYFIWNENDAAIALGYGSLYNHSTCPNARYETYYDDGYIHFIAAQYIAAHTEILVNYNHAMQDKSKVWFEQGFEKK